jgi:cellulose biosynthesis protein BcsQ
MYSIAMFNNKGGVGKTTLLCNLAAWLGLKLKKKILVIDADPQCNTTQLVLSEEEINRIYDTQTSFTIYSMVRPLSQGKGYAKDIMPISVADYGFDLIPGDPRLALQEDFLSKDWSDATSGLQRGFQTSMLFKQLISKSAHYDYVLFDMGPSLGSINRAVLLACDFFLSPMSIDIFSLKAVENIGNALETWDAKWKSGLVQLDQEGRDDFDGDLDFDIKFCGYVAQQYTQKTTAGVKRAVTSYEKILKRIPATIEKSLLKGKLSLRSIGDYEIGKIPNLHSLVPMSQSARKPIFELKAKDGVRGAHFNKVEEAGVLFREITKKLIINIDEIQKNG